MSKGTIPPRWWRDKNAERLRLSAGRGQNQRLAASHRRLGLPPARFDEYVRSGQWRAEPTPRA